jgi:8-hydroxy-5-deazaflavin:NADPH oxidoreductase
MKIGLIGSGHVGGALGTQWARAGHQVVFSSRHPESDQIKNVLRNAGSSARAGTVLEAAQDSDVVVLATPWSTTQQAVQTAGDLRAKIVVDTTNPLLPDLSGLIFSGSSSGGEEIAKWAPGAHVVKAFNTIGHNIMADPNLGGQQATLLYCGDDDRAKSVVHSLAADIGFEPFEIGPLSRAGLLEDFALLWIRIAMKQGREFAFKMIRRE